MKRISKEGLRDARLAEADQPCLSPVDEIIAEVAAGRPVVVTDDAGRENEGDLIVAAQHATPQAIAFMAREGRGLVCLALPGADADRLGLRLAARRGPSRHGTAFTASIEARTGVTTGISAADRARTIAVAADPRSGPGDIATPGHVFPLRARAGGVLERPGHTEAAVDLARAAGLPGAAVICEIMNDDGTMARGPDLAAFAARHGLKTGTVAALAEWRRARGDVPPPEPAPGRARVMVVQAPFYAEISDALLAGARGALEGCEVEVFTVPGALEVPAAIALGARRLEDPFDAFVALGCVIRGETTHYETVAEQSARGLTDLSLRGLAVGNGILTCENRAQAEARADPSGKKDVGGGAARAVLALLQLRRTLLSTA